MEKCKLTFESESGQKIILNFTLQENMDLNFKTSFDPKIDDPKADLGLSGMLCELFLTSLENSSEEHPVAYKTKSNLVC